jgi:hypothetical protein
VDTLVEADALGEEDNRVLPEDAVENGHLTNLGHALAKPIMVIPCLNPYRCDVIEEFPQKSNNVIHIPVSFDKAQPLTPCQFANNIKRKELQPLTKVAALACARKHLVRLVEPVCQGGVNKRLVVDERAHSESVVDASSILCVEVFIRGGEERKKRLAF